MRSPHKVLEKALGYRFRKKRHVEKALTHPSFRYEEDGIDADNQRLEFLGDAALGLVVAAYLFARHPERQEGELTRMRSRVTSRHALAQIARGIDLGAYLKLGRGEEQSGGRERPSNLADALEAVLGAAYLDGKMKAVEKIFSMLFIPVLEGVDDEPWSDNPKGELQEFCQGQWKVSPRYRLLTEEGPPHAKIFSVEVSMDDRVLGRGTGPNKRAAEMAAARRAMTTVAREEEPPTGQ